MSQAPQSKETVAMPENVRARCLKLRKESKKGGYLSPQDMAFLEDCYKKWPQDYAELGEIAFKETLPFGARQHYE